MVIDDAIHHVMDCGKTEIPNSKLNFQTGFGLKSSLISIFGICFHIASTQDHFSSDLISFQDFPALTDSPPQMHGLYGPET